MTPSAILWEYKQILMMEAEKRNRSAGLSTAIEDNSYEEFQASLGLTAEKLKELRRGDR